MPVLGEADGVLCYLRFRDDIFVVARNREAANKALTVLQGRASKCWKVELQEVSSHSASMLDCRVFKGLGVVSCGRDDYSPYIKPTARHVPLDQSSAHTQCVHRSWPIGEIARMYSRSSRPAIFEYLRRVKIRRFEQFFIVADLWKVLYTEN